MDKVKEILEKFLKEIKKECNPDDLGMILTHIGVVRGVSKDGTPIKQMYLDFSKEKLEKLISTYEKKEGICKIKIWINKGLLKIGEPIMVVVIGGAFRKNVLPCFEEIIEILKKEIVVEKEEK